MSQSNTSPNNTLLIAVLTIAEDLNNGMNEDYTYLLADLKTVPAVMLNSDSRAGELYRAGFELGYAAAVYAQTNLRPVVYEAFKPIGTDNPVIAGLAYGTVDKKGL
jgi:hypothetical protein